MNGFLKVPSSLLLAGTLLVSFLWVYSGHPQFFGFPPAVERAEAAQFARPDSDASIGSWTGSPVNTVGNRWQNIDETSASDSDFVRSQNDPSNSAAEFGLSNVTDPLLSSGHIVRYRYRKGETGGGQPGTVNITVELRQGTTVIASQTHNNAGTSFADGSFTLTSGQADGITDYTDLRLRFSANKSAGARTSWGEISWAELETPNVAAPDLSWDDPSIPGYTFSIYQSSSLTFGSGTLVCQAELTDDNASTVGCLSGTLAPSTQYRVEAKLFNNGNLPATMDSGDFVDDIAVKSGWAGTTPSLGSCAFDDDFGDDIIPSCSVSFNGNDVRVTNTSGSVVIGATEYEGFAYLITTDSDVPLTNSTSYMNASVDSVTEDSSKITITGPQPTFTQSAYRWFANANSTNVGSALALQDVAATLSSTGQAFRLRMLLHISNQTLPQSGQDFKLQFAAKGGGTCVSPAGSYNDILLNAGTWTQLSPTGGPPNARHQHSAVWDDLNNVMYVFAGDDTGAGFVNDLWEYDPSGNTWTQLSPTGGPPVARVGHSAAWDTTSSAMYVFGGDTSSGDANDAWEYDPSGNTWTDLSPSTRPDARTEHSAVWDDLNNVMYVFGGFGSARLNDLWEFDLPAAGVVAYNNNFTPADGVALTGNAGDPSHEHTTRNQTYEEENNFTNSQLAIAAGEDGMWDFSLIDNGAPAGTTYCFRAVKSDGSVLSAYDVRPEITTVSAGNSTPTVSAVEVNNSTAITLNEGTSKTVTATTTVTDADGCSDISSVVADFYMQTAVGATACDSTGEANDNQCYPRVTCSVVGGTCGGGGDTSADYTCNFNVWYIARPTDAGSSDSADIWQAKVTANDGEATGTGTDNEEINTLRALSVTPSINYGNLDTNTDTGSSNATTTITNTGNAAIDVEISGTAMTFSSNSIAVSNQKYGTSSVAYSSLSFTLSGTPTQRELDLAKPTATSTPALDDLFWGLFVPLSTPSGTYNGTNTFTPVSDT